MKSDIRKLSRSSAVLIGTIRVDRDDKTQSVLTKKKKLKKYYKNYIKAI